MIRERLILFIGLVRLRIEGRTRAEYASPRWDALVRWIER